MAFYKNIFLMFFIIVLVACAGESKGPSGELYYNVDAEGNLTDKAIVFNKKGENVYVVDFLYVSTGKKGKASRKGVYEPDTHTFYFGEKVEHMAMVWEFGEDSDIIYSKRRVLSYISESLNDELSKEELKRLHESSLPR